MLLKSACWNGPAVHRLRLFSLVMAPAFLLAACITPSTSPPKIGHAARAEEALKQRKLVLQRRLQNTKKIADIAFKLKQANVALCPKVRHVFGMNMHIAAQYEGDLADAAKALYNLADFPKVLYVSAGSPAQKAGLLAGDALIALGEMPLNADKRTFKRLTKKLNANDGAAVHLRINRAGEELTLSITPTEVCDIPIGISPSPKINARANGRSVLINDGMLRFAKNDAELAFIIGHEMAHNTMGHIPSEGANIGFGMLGGMLLDAALISVGIITPGVFAQAGAGAGYLLYSPSFEREADYVGAYYTARAGYSIANADTLWRRIGARNPADINSERSTHPPTAIRVLALRKTMEEIRHKQNTGAALVPNFKAGRHSEQQPE